ncbi:sugar (and other) transporter family protein [Paraburkholderia fungorum]|jgi:EmrB/QacA subfamily drug resistance transporter|uniref:MFS transporter n=1 Tax=Paraburkholderia fungorum TaxID=134537 RepID=A0AAP5QGF8_9BURK|nr:MFS transporter [Paraburkholderia fungorum]AJZ62555.1 sugar (and other) transporter family protein [Paraburkholderia fungorum]MDT8843235.1 MFS transporter [Paraburkholderia fungorum]PRZ51700.1 EmrB/QacA subfamily drug resistance transporter [Paraburkholderia fungorum]
MTPSLETPPPNGQLLPFRESLLAMLGIAFVSMLVALDQTIVGTALPRIVADLKGFDLYAWVATAYMLASVITIPIFGRLGDLFGRKPFLIAAILLFTGASVLCGFATSMLLLVMARGLQGIGGGILIGTVFATVADLFPNPKLRLRWLVFVTSAFGLANMVGPTLGGMLTQYGGWRLVFFVNVPVGVVSLLFVQRFLPPLRHLRSKGPVRLDWLGAFVIAVTFGALQLLIELFPKHGIDTITTMLAVVAASFALTLWLWERRIAYPIIPVDMLLDRKLFALFAMSVLGGFALFSLVFYVPLLFQGGYAMSAHDSGMLITPLLLGTTIGSVVNNRIVTRIRRANGIMYVGFALSALACLSVVVLRGTEPHLVWMSCMGISGLGLGLVATSLTVCSQQIVARDQLGAATALLQSLRTFGGMLGTVMTGALLGHLYTQGVHRSLTSYQATQWFKSFASPELLVDRAEQAALIDRLVSAGHAGDAMMNSARDTLVQSIHIGILVAGAAALTGLCLAWFVPPVRIGYLEAEVGAGGGAAQGEVVPPRGHVL